MGFKKKVGSFRDFKNNIDFKVQKTFAIVSGHYIKFIHIDPAITDILYYPSELLRPPSNTTRAVDESYPHLINIQCMQCCKP